MVLKIVKILGLTILTLVGLFILIIGYFKLGRSSDFTKQKKMIEVLKKNAVVINEQDFVDFPLDTDVKLNEIQMIATHNSYKKMPDRLRWLCIAGYDKVWADRLRYEHDTLTNQFNRGVRSIELDVRKRKNRFELTHIPLVDDRATSPDFALALEEIKLWSDNNQGHMPLMVMIELKKDWEILDPAIQTFNPEILDELDDTLRASFDEGQILLPDDVRVEGYTLEESILNNGWPRLQDVRGKIMFIMLPSKAFRDMYLDGHESLKGRVMFAASTPGQPEAAVIFSEQPEVEKIKELAKKNYIVRTRADAHSVVDSTRTENSLISGGHILSTDFPPGEPDAKTDFTFTVIDDKTVRLNPLFLEE